jgi:hypothetical protein
MGKASRSDEVSAVARTVEAVLGDPDAVERRQTVLSEDPRDESEIEEGMASFDLLVDWVLALDTAPLPVPSDGKAVQTELRLEAATETNEEPPALPPETQEEDTLETDDDFGTAAAFDAADSSIQVDVSSADAKTPRKSPSPPPTDQRKLITRLYEDVRWLFAINDVEAALVSLERMLVLASPEGEAGVFLQRNDAKLLELYESYIGPFEKVPSVDHAEGAIDASQLLRHQRLADIMSLVDGERSIGALIEASQLSRLETCAALKQLERTGHITL